MGIESFPRDTALAAFLYHICAGPDSPCTLPNCFPVASFGKPTGADQKNLLYKYLCTIAKKLSTQLILTSLMEFHLQIWD